MIFPKAQTLSEAAKVWNLYLQASKLDIWLMESYPVSSILKSWNETTFRVLTEPLHQVLIWYPGSVLPRWWFSQKHWVRQKLPNFQTLTYKLVSWIYDQWKGTQTPQFKKIKSDTISAPYRTLTLDPKLRSWQCSVAFVVIFLSARGPAGQDCQNFKSLPHKLLIWVHT